MSAGTSTDDGEARCDALGEAIAAVLGGVLRNFDERASGVGRSQEELALSLDRINLERDKLSEDAPVPLIMQKAAKISSIRKRILLLNMRLKSIQRRIDRIDQIISAGSSGISYKWFNLRYRYHLLQEEMVLANIIWCCQFLPSKWFNLRRGILKIHQQKYPTRMSKMSTRASNAAYASPFDDPDDWKPPSQDQQGRHSGTRRMGGVRRNSSERLGPRVLHL